VTDIRLIKGCFSVRRPHAFFETWAFRTGSDHRSTIDETPRGGIAIGRFVEHSHDAARCVVCTRARMICGQLRGQRSEIEHHLPLLRSGTQGNDRAFKRGFRRKTEGGQRVKDAILHKKVLVKRSMGSAAYSSANKGSALRRRATLSCCPTIQSVSPIEGLCVSPARATRIGWPTFMNFSSCDFTMCATVSLTASTSHAERALSASISASIAGLDSALSHFFTALSLYSLGAS